MMHCTSTPLLLLLFLLLPRTAAAPPPPPPPRGVALLKTHKTGGTTLGGALFRFEAARSRRIFSAGNATAACAAPGAFASPPCLLAHALTPLPTAPHQQRADAVLNHVSMEGNLSASGTTFTDVLRLYDATLGSENDTAPYLLVIPVREPVARYASWFHFYGRYKRLPSAAAPEAPTLDEWIASQNGANGFASEFGARSDADVEALLSRLAAPAPRVLFFPAERFDDAMLLLAEVLAFSWHDTLYLRLQESGAYPAPDATQRAAIAAQSALDARIYEAAMATFEADLSELRAKLGESRWARRRDALSARLHVLRSSATLHTPACAALRDWYLLDDLAHEGSIDPLTWRAPPAPRGTSREEMAAAFAASNGTAFC
jgi:hypothetical protein